jgi:transcriptional regulator with XRE-family HTH domain
MAKQRATVGGRSLGLELLRLRKATKLSTRAVGARIGWSASTVSRLERGVRQETTVEEVAALLAIYGVTGGERDRLLKMAKWPSELGWWDPAGEQLPTQTRNYLNFENNVVAMTDFEPLLVPGLLQTPEYARAVMTATDVRADEHEIEANVARRIGRQALLTRPNAPAVHTIMAEAVLRRPLGGGKVMSHQVRHIVNLVEQRPNVSVRVIPDGVVAHVGLAGPFVIMEFAAAPTIVFVETLKAGLFIDSPDDVQVYRLAAEKLTELALAEPESLELLSGIAAELARE